MCWLRWPFLQSGVGSNYKGHLSAWLLSQQFLMYFVLVCTASACFVVVIVVFFIWNIYRSLEQRGLIARKIWQCDFSSFPSVAGKFRKWDDSTRRHWKCSSAFNSYALLTFTISITDRSTDLIVNLYQLHIDSWEFWLYLSKIMEMSSWF